MKRQSLQLKERRNEKVKLAEAILESSTEDKPLSDEQRKLLDSLMADIKQLNGDIDRAEFVESMQDSGQVNRPPIQIRPDTDPAAKSLIPANQLRSAKLRGFKGPNAEEDAYKAGMWALATLWNYDKAKKFCKDHGIPMILNAALEGDNTKGGFLVPDFMERTIIDLREEYGLFRQLARVRPMPSDYMTVPRRAGGLTAYAVGEASDFTESTKLWTAINLTARKWGVLAKYSSEIAEDSVINIADDLAQEIAYAFAFAEDQAGFNGDGSATYHGITGVVTKFNNQVSGGASTYAGALDAASGHDTFAEIDNNDLTNLTAKVPQYALGRAAWICSTPCWATVFQRLQAAAGGNTKVDLAGGMSMDSYLGYPIYRTPAMPTSTGDLSDTVMLLFGDMRSAISMGTRRGVSLAVSTDRYFESDQIAIRGTERFDINVHDIGDTSTAGPLVALIAD